MNEFRNKVVLVTGCASGIGLAQAKLFLEHGANVYGLDQNEMSEKISATKFNFTQLNLLDLTCLKKFSEQLATVDILLNTAGILDDYRNLAETDFNLWQSILQNNLNSIFLTTKLFLPKMLAQGSGVIINLASIAGFVAGGGGIAYTTSKHAIVGFTKQLALDYADRLRVYGIAPGAIKTPMNAKDFANGGMVAQQVAQETPMGRWGLASEVAELTLFLASSKASFLQGNIVPIDGGWLLK